MAKRTFILYTGFSNDDHVKFKDVACRAWNFYTQNISFYIYNRHQTRSVLHNNRAYSIFRSLRLVRVFHNTEALEKRVKPRDEMAKKIWIWFLLLHLYKNVCTLQTIPTSVFDFEQWIYWSRQKRKTSSGRHLIDINNKKRIITCKKNEKRSFYVYYSCHFHLKYNYNLTLYIQLEFEYTFFIGVWFD